jgi:hypothetical protein
MYESEWTRWERPTPGKKKMNVALYVLRGELHPPFIKMLEFKIQQRSQKSARSSDNLHATVHNLFL